MRGFHNWLIAIDPATGRRHDIHYVGTADVVASPSYSPDGTKLAYLLGPFDGSALNGVGTMDSIWVLDTTTGHSSKLTTCHGCFPGDYISWSPDGSRLVFSEKDQRGSYQLYLIDADGTHRTQLTHFPDAFPATQDATNPTWSPDGTEIVFTATQSIDVIRPDGTGLAELIGSPGAPLGPAWSPNGSRIAYVLDPPQPGGGLEHQYQLWLMNPDGSHRTQIFRQNGCCILGGFFAGPAWSPDGTRIATVIGQTLWVMNADGSGPTSKDVLIGDRPTWQPVP